MAGCVFSVKCRSASSPQKHISESENPSASSAASKTSRAAAKLSARSFPIPTDCEPCPGNMYAIGIPNQKSKIKDLKSNYRRSPRYAAAERGQQHQASLFDL